MRVLTSVRSHVKRWFDSISPQREKRIFQSVSILSWITLLSLLMIGGWQNRDKVIPFFRQANYWRLLAASGFYLISLTCATVGWFAIARHFTNRLTWWTHTRIYCYTLSARRLPGTIWYVGGRIAYYKQVGISEIDISAASTIEYVVGLMTGCGIGLLLLSQNVRLPAYLTLLLVVGALAALASLHPAFLNRIMIHFKRPMAKKYELPHLLLWVTAWSATWIMGGLMVTQIVSAFQPVNGKDIFWIVSSWALSGVAGLLTILLPSSLGMTELSLTGLLSIIMPLPLAAFVAIYTRLITTVFEILVSALFYPTMRKGTWIKPK